MELNAAAPQPQQDEITLVASSGYTRLDNSTSFGGYKNFTTDNRFAYYAELVCSNTFTFTALMKTVLSLVKGMRFGADSPSDIEEFNKWGKHVDFFQQACSVGTLLLMNGVYVGITSGMPNEFKLTPLLMPTVTLIPEGQKPGECDASAILQPPVVSVVINESDSDNRSTIDANKVVYGAFNAFLKKQPDIMNRNTYGIYGTSLIEPIELSIRNLLTIDQGYVSFVKKYGQGRYVYDFKMLYDAVVSKGMSPKKAQEFVDDFMEKHKYMKANEDIAGVGIDVKALDASGTLDVMGFQKRLETNIQVGLLQDPLTMGDSRGSTYGAGYMAEESRMLVLESLQRIESNILQQAIDKRLVLMKKEPGSVWVEFDELSKPKMEAGDVGEWVGMGILDTDDARAWGGFPTRAK